MSEGGWADGALRSPLSGRPLSRLGDGRLVAGDEVWPVIDGIPFLRADRAGMARAAAGMIGAGNVVGATALLLTDQDPFAPDPPPAVAVCAGLVRDVGSASFREAMAGLGFGRVADYFAHRWSDPTFLSGLALLGRALPAGGAPVVFEPACGAGHFLEALGRAGVPAIGADLVFAKLWLARHFVSPDARLVCMDAQASWPLRPGDAGIVFCHDAFYFLPDKPGIAAQMRRLVGADGTIAVGHAHNAAVGNHSAGRPLGIAAYAALFPGAALFDDEELGRAFAEGRAAVPAAADALDGVAALSLLCRPAGSGADRAAGFGMERSGRPLRLNPLYRRDGDGVSIEWPSVRYRDEYAALASYPAEWAGPDMADPGRADLEALRRRRVYLDLPARW